MPTQDDNHVSHKTEQGGSADDGAGAVVQAAREVRRACQWLLSEGVHCLVVLLPLQSCFETSAGRVLTMCLVQPLRPDELGCRLSGVSFCAHFSSFTWLPVPLCLVAPPPTPPVVRPDLQDPLEVKHVTHYASDFFSYSCMLPLLTVCMCPLLHISSACPCASSVH